MVHLKKCKVVTTQLVLDLFKQIVELHLIWSSNRSQLFVDLYIMSNSQLLMYYYWLLSCIYITCTFSYRHNFVNIILWKFCIVGCLHRELVVCIWWRKHSSRVLATKFSTKSTERCHCSSIGRNGLHKHTAVSSNGEWRQWWIP